MSIKPTAKKKRGPAPKFGRRPTLTIRVQEPLYLQIKDAAAGAGRSISEEIELRLERLAHWEDRFGSEKEMLTMLGHETDETIKAVMFRRQWGKVVDVRYGGAVFIPPGQHALPSSEFINEADEAEREKRAAALNQQFETTLEKVVTRAVKDALAEKEQSR